MRLAVVAAGKLRDAGLQSLCDDYTRRIQPFVPLELVEVKDAAGLRARWTDRTRGAGTRVLLALAVCAGATNAILQLALWALYMSTSGPVDQPRRSPAVRLVTCWCISTPSPRA